MSEPHPSAAGIRVENLTKVYSAGLRHKTQTVALDDVSLEVRAGEFLVLLGPSGCGKSTLLRCLAGLEQPASGAITMGGFPVFDALRGINMSPDRRPMSMIFQSYALWPHMTAFDHVAYPLRSQRADRATIGPAVRDMLDRVGISELTDRLPAEMSGGQQQRLALARALVGGAQVILFDEPLSNVDAVVREKLRMELIRMQRALGFTAVYVTHDQEEALHLADRIAVMGTGRIHQLGDPESMYLSPADVHVARFLGHSNEIALTVERYEDGVVVGRSRRGPISTRWDSSHTPDPTPGESLSAFGRPPQFSLHRPSHAPNDSPNQWSGMVEAVRFLGTHVEYLVSADGDRLRCWFPVARRGDFAEGDPVVISIATEDLLAVRAGGEDGQ